MLYTNGGVDSYEFEQLFGQSTFPILGPEICIYKMENCNSYRVIYTLHDSDPTSIDIALLKFFEIEIINGVINLIQPPTVIESIIGAQISSIVIGKKGYFFNDYLFLGYTDNSGQNYQGSIIKYNLSSGFPNSKQVIFQSNNTTIQPFEFELSSNNHYLAASNISYNITNEVSLFKLTNTGNLDVNFGTNGFVGIDIPKNNDYLFCLGLEFSENNNFLYASIQNTGIFQIDLNTLSVSSSVLSGSENYGNSQLEKASNGKIYGFDGTGLLGGFSQNITLPSISDFVNVSSNFIVSYDHHYFNATGPLATLPQQIDNFNTDKYFLQDFECCNNNVEFDATEYTVPQTTTWMPGLNPFGVSGNDIYIKDKIIVPPNVKLTIKGLNIHFSPNASIEIQAGSSEDNRAGKLVIDNSILTVDQRCTNMMLWKGIWAEGNSSQNQYPVPNPIYQSKVEVINNSVIEHAEVGIGLWDGTTFSTSGSFVETSNSTFRNNFLDIYFPPYNFRDFSKIGNTTFIKDDHLIDGRAYSQMIYLNGRKEISWHSNSFLVSNPTVIQDYRYNTNNPNMPYGGRALTGIYAIDSDLRMRGYTNTFQGLTHGIWSSAGVKQPILALDQLTFNNCKRGIRVDAVDGATITRNNITFNIPTQQPYSEPLEPYMPFPNEVTYGISLNALTGYTVEENQILGGRQANEFGIRAINLGGTNLDIYKNDIQECTFSQNALGKNNRFYVNSNNIDVYEGLNYECNTNALNERDFTIWPNLFNTAALEGIRKLQTGSDANIPATGNTFSANPTIIDGHIYNHDVNQIQNIDYIFYSSIINQIPIYYTSQNNKVQTAQNELNQPFCNSRFGDDEEPIELLSEGRLISEKGKLRLKKLAVANIENQLATETDSTEIVLLSNQLIREKTALVLAGFMVIKHYQRDTLEEAYDSLIHYLQQLNYYETNRMLMLHYLFENDELNYNALQAEMETEPYFQEPEVQEFDQLATFSSIVNLLEDSVTSILEFEPLTLFQLMEIDSSNAAQLSIRARNILRQYDYHWAEEPNIPNITKRSVASVLPTALNDLEKGSFIFPNPANNEIVINLKGISATSITITNIKGQIVNEVPIRNQESLNVNLDLIPGVYAVNIFNDNQLVKTNKLIVQ